MDPVWTREMEKRLATRVQTVLCDRRLYRVLDRFGGAVFRRSSVFHGLDEFLSANEVAGDLCLEIGTWNGLTAVVLSRYFNRVVSIDIVNNPLKREIIDYLKIENIQFRDVKDNAEKARIAAELPFDFAYLDGDHAGDTTSDWELVRRCGRVLFHEAWPFQKPVWRLVHSLPLTQVAMNGEGLALWDGSKPVALPVDDE